MAEHCDVAISGVGGVSDWPCMLPADHRGAHLYDTAVDVRAELDKYKAQLDAQADAGFRISLERLTLDVQQLREWADLLGGKASYALSVAADLLESGKTEWSNTLLST